MELEVFKILVYGWIILAILLFPLLLRVKAPYGRHTTSSWGILVDNRTGWLVMELPSLLLFVLLFLTGNPREATVEWVFFAVWVIHYTNRIFIFPFRTRTKGKKIPLTIIVLAMFFNLVNGFINGMWIGHLSGGYSHEWISDPRFVAGLLIFAAGFMLNQSSDTTLISLRSGGARGYFIPHGRMFNYVSCPNFLGEIIEWSGFAIMTWSLPGISFAVWTAANLIPRAIHHHRWYHETFPDYPAERKAIIPGII